MLRALQRIEVLTLVAGALAAGAVWLPVTTGDDAAAAVRPVAWTARTDPSVRIGFLASKPLLDPARGQVVAGSAGVAIKPDGAAPVSAADVGRRYLLRGLARIDQRDVAVIEDVTANRVVRLQRGQVVGDWYLSAVSGRQATLKNDAGIEETLTLVPAVPRAPPMPTTAQPAAALPFKR
jgi:MoxR-like ATPase